MRKVHESTITHEIAAFLCGLCLLFIILATSVQAVCFWVPNWWRNEYAKYDTPSRVTGEMSLDDAVHVTEDMLDYCIGRKDTLDDTEATIDGVTSPFFTDREKAHLVDCRKLFLGGLRYRAIAALMLIALCIYIYVHEGRESTPAVLARGYLRAFAAVIAVSLIVALVSAIDFTFAFTIFHRIFFDNDLWLLDPHRDNLVNIMQEAVFADTAAAIAGIFAICSLAVAVIAFVTVRRRPQPHQS